MKKTTKKTATRKAKGRAKPAPVKTADYGSVSAFGFTRTAEVTIYPSLGEAFRAMLSGRIVRQLTVRGSGHVGDCGAFVDRVGVDDDGRPLVADVEVKP